MGNLGQCAGACEPGGWAGGAHAGCPACMGLLRQLPASQEETLSTGLSPSPFIGSSQTTPNYAPWNPLIMANPPEPPVMNIPLNILCRPTPSSWRSAPSSWRSGRRGRTRGAPGPTRSASTTSRRWATGARRAALRGRCRCVLCRVLCPWSACSFAGWQLWVARGVLVRARECPPELLLRLGPQQLERRHRPCAAFLPARRPASRPIQSTRPHLICALTKGIWSTC